MFFSASQCHRFRHILQLRLVHTTRIGRAEGLVSIFHLGKDFKSVSFTIGSTEEFTCCAVHTPGWSMVSSSTTDTAISSSCCTVWTSPTPVNVNFVASYQIRVEIIRLIDRLSTRRLWVNFMFRTALSSNVDWRLIQWIYKLAAGFALHSRYVWSPKRRINERGCSHTILSAPEQLCKRVFYSSDSIAARLPQILFRCFKRSDNAFDMKENWLQITLSSGYSCSYGKVSKVTKLYCKGVCKFGQKNKNKHAFIVS